MEDAVKPRVALVAHGVHDAGGMERACTELIRHTADDFDFVVVSAVLQEDLRPLVRKWERIRVPMRPISMKFPAFWVLASCRLRDLRVDLIHTVGAIVWPRADVAGVHFCTAGYVAAQRGLAPDGAPLLRRVNTSMSRLLALAGERWCYRPGRIRACAAVSSGVAEEAARYFPDIPFHITPNGVDHGRFREDAISRRDVRLAENVDDQPVAIFVGGDWDRKGLQIAIEAVARVRNDDIDLRLWVVGDGDVARFRTIAGDLGVGDAASFLGLRTDVERYLAGADIFVLPSSYETFGLVAFEAAAVGLPIVATKVHGISDLLADGDAGILVRRNAESVAGALATLASDDQLRIRLGRGALRRSAGYSWEAAASSVTALYRSLLPENVGASA